MINMEYIRELEYITGKVREAYKLFAENPPEDIIQKTEFDLVTNIDIAIENFLVQGIKANFPDDNILSEELYAKNKVLNRTWTIDPIDGTCNMAHRIPLYGIQCALVDHNEIVMSVIYLPVYDELFSAVVHSGVMLNGQRVSANRISGVNNAIISFGDYSHSNMQNARIEHQAIGNLYNKIAKVRFFGAACVDFSYTAIGRVDGSVVITNNLWDIAPGLLLCKEAGMIVTNLDGEIHNLFDKGVVVSANCEIHELLIESLKLQ